MRRACGLLATLSFSIGLATAGPGAEIPREVQDQVDALVVKAYEAAGSKLPCKIGTGGKLHMLRWQAVDKCMSQAIARVDWAEFSRELAPLRPAGVTEADFAAAVEKALVRNALPYNRVFQVKDPKALLPLTNPILRYMPPDSILNQPVIDAAGATIGTFAGAYFSEKAGGLVSGTTVRTSLFQYRDSRGDLQVPSARLLLDSFGVSWDLIKEKSGFRLPSETLNLPGAGR